MKMVGFGEHFDGLVRSVLEALHPDMSANDGLDQTLVARAFRFAIASRHGCGILRPARPRNSDLLGRAFGAGGCSELYQQLIAGNDDTVKRLKRSESTIRVFLLAMCVESGEDSALDVCRSDTAN